MRVKVLKYSVYAIAFTLLLTISVVFSPDPVSAKIRSVCESHINLYIENLTSKASEGELASYDKYVLKTSILLAVNLSRFKYPEAAKVLQHYVYGDGSKLQLDADYFQQSLYLNSVIAKLGAGEYGPLSLRQSQDWRLSLAFNPYYLSITEDQIRVYHPNISFAPINGPKVFTIVPIGRMKIKVFDNLISALSPTPFYLFTEWSR